MSTYEEYGILAASAVLCGYETPHRGYSLLHYYTETVLAGLSKHTLLLQKRNSPTILRPFMMQII